MYDNSKCLSCDTLEEFSIFMLALILLGLLIHTKANSQADILVDSLSKIYCLAPMDTWPLKLEVMDEIYSEGMWKFNANKGNRKEV